MDKRKECQCKINIFFDDNGPNIIEILENDFSVFIQQYIKETLSNQNK